MLLCRKLTHVDYSTKEISDLIQPHLPLSFSVDVPAGSGRFSLNKTHISMPHKSNKIQAKAEGCIEITYLGNPIYRAHLVLEVKAKPYYDSRHHKILLTDLYISEIYLLNDEYSVLKDTSTLLNQLVPSPVLNVLTGTMKTAFNLMTGSTTTEASRYLHMYLGGSKQKVLDFHKPQLEHIIIDLAASEDMQYRLDKNDFEENLFIQFGKEVVVEDGYLRFKF